MQEQLADFIARHESRVAGLGDPVASIRHLGSVLGSEDTVDGGTRALSGVLADRDAFSRIRTYAHADVDVDPVLRRHAQSLYRCYLAHQSEARQETTTEPLKEEIRTGLEAFRCDVGNGPLSWDETWKIFASDADSNTRRAAWTRLMDLGDHLAATMLELVATRNRAARDHGFRNHFELAALLCEIDPTWTSELLVDAVTQTREQRQLAKETLAKETADGLGISRRALRGWHLTDPMSLLSRSHGGTTGPVNDEHVAALRAFLACRGLGLPPAETTPAEEVADQAELSPHDTLNQLGRGLYDSIETLFSTYADPNLPAGARRSPHPSVTWALWFILSDELTAPDFLEGMLGYDSGTAAALRNRFEEQRNREMLFLSHHALTMLSFQRALYGNPGQDLPGTWWGLLEQGLGVPSGGGSHIHTGWTISSDVLGPPMQSVERALGAIMAAQIREQLPTMVAGSRFLHDHTSAETIKSQLLWYAAGRSWQEHISHLTESPLRPDAFVQQLTPIDA